MKKLFKFAGYVGAAVVLFFIVASVAFYHLTRTGDFRRYLISAIEQQTGLKVQLGEAHLDVGRILGVSFRDVALAESDLAAPALSAERVTARVALWPLLNRQLVFYEVRLQKPDARLTRDRQGKIPFLERLLNLPFLKQSHAQFALDLRTVKIADGRFEFIDGFSEAAPVTTRFHGVALVLERERAAALQEILRQWVGSKTAQPQGAALKFELAAAVEREGQGAKWRAQGKLVFPESKLELAQAWCDVETRISGTPAALLRLYGDKSPAAKNLGGSLDARLKMRGNLQQRLHVTGMVDFDRLSIDAPELFARPVDAGDGRLHIDLQLQPEHWTLARMEFHSKDLTLAVKGQLRPVANADTQLKLDFTAKPVPIKVVKKYLPTKWLASTPFQTFFSAVTEGELILHKAGVNAKSGEIRGMLNTGLDERLSLDAEIRKGAANFSGGYPPLRALNGRIVLEKGRFGFHNVSATAGQSRLSNVEGSYSLQEDSGLLQLRARGEVELSELREQAQRGILPAELTKALLAVHALGGGSRFDMALTRLGDEPPRAEGKLSLDNARLQWDAYALTDIDGDLMFTPTEIKTERVRALIHGSPVEMRLALRNYTAADGMFDLTVESAGVKAGIVSSVLLDKGSMQDTGTVRGSVRYRGSFNDKQELVNVQIPVYPLVQPLRQLNGKISIDENGIDFQRLNGLLVGAPASASARWRYAQKPQLIFDFAAPSLDITYLISQIDPEPTEFYAALQAEGRVALAKGRLRNFDFADLKTNLILDRRTWRFPNLTIRAGGGSVSGPLTVAHKPDTLGVVAEPNIQNVPMAPFLRWLEITHSEITGTLDIRGKFDTSGNDEVERKRNLNGAFSVKISEGTIHRMRMLVQLLNVLDLSRWFTFQLPDLGKQGIRFRAITGDFKVTQGVYHTENLVVDSDDLRMTGAGKIDVPKDEIDLIVAVRPFSGVDSAINYIPLLGRGIAAVKNSFLVASFNIKGRIDDPTITPAPLGTLSEWVLGVLRIPRSLIPFGADEKDATEEAPQERPAAPNR
jgi:uncharacterized protein involved in outer membrane biogenesis